jgi:hypothetical protein
MELLKGNIWHVLHLRISTYWASVDDQGMGRKPLRLLLEFSIRKLPFLLTSRDNAKGNAYVSKSLLHCLGSSSCTQNKGIGNLAAQPGL